MARTEQEKAIVERGKLWSEFSKTTWGQDLFGFFAEQEKLAKDATFDCLLSGDEHQAKQAAFKLSGVMAVKSYIEDSVSEMNSLLEWEKHERAERRTIPSHV